ncbi:hypothetical protein [Streptomyces sp. NPDC005485]|uniref:hypothetical protein n=1 Tax=Streptomyces sp. NPDC005485 TaxID=3155591 RepID=UPI0033BC4AC8
MPVSSRRSAFMEVTGLLGALAATGAGGGSAAAAPLGGGGVGLLYETGTAGPYETIEFRWLGG